MMLRKFGNILIVMIFSIAVSLFNVGTAMVYCSHNHTMKVAIATSSLHSHKPKTCKTNSSCMQHKHLKLSPTGDVHIEKPVLTPMTIDAILRDVIGDVVAATCVVRHIGEKANLLRLHPPRAYLLSISVLII